jgi:RNA polymerase sigma-70 factor, ECF subfamily
MDWQTTTQVLEALKTSDNSAVWQNFRDNFYPVVVNFARHIGLSPSDADDAAQETMVAFVKAYRAGKYDRDKGRLNHWLFGLARNVILNVRRNLGPEQLIADKTGGPSFWNLLQDEKNVPETWTTQWRKVVLDRCMKRARQELDEKTFSAFEFLALGEMPAGEVAKKLEMTENAVYIAKSRVLSRLRQLEEEFEGPAEGTKS